MFSFSSRFATGTVSGSGSGSGAFPWTASANPSTDARSAIVNAGGYLVTVTQDGWPHDTLPQIADGDYWKTSIILVNLVDHTITWNLKFYGDDGKPKEFTLSGRGKSSDFSGVLPVGGSVTLVTPGGTGQLNQGWAQVLSPAGDDVGAMVIFGTSGVPGRPDFEASVPAVSNVDVAVMIPFDNTNGYVTSLAILNPGAYSDSVLNIRVLDESGAELANEKLPLKAGVKLAFPSIDRWAASRGRKGTIVIKGDGPMSASSLALRFHPGGAFTTVFPLSR